jgi:hypothetical protein
MEKELNEPVLDADYPMYGDYFYVVDGEVRRSHLHDVTVARYKRITGAKEVRRCDAIARRLFDDWHSGLLP